MNTIETCAAADAAVLIASEEADLADTLDGYDGLPVICIENGAGHSYVITGSLGELADFAAKVSIAVLGVEALYAQLPRCASCGRVESACSRNPCAAVVADRCDDDADLIASELANVRQGCTDCISLAWKAVQAGEPARGAEAVGSLTADARYALAHQKLLSGSDACPLHRQAALPVAS